MVAAIYFAFVNWKSVGTKDVLFYTNTGQLFILVCYVRLQLANCLTESHRDTLIAFSTYFLYSCHSPKLLIFNIKLSCFGIASEMLVSAQRI